MFEEEQEKEQELRKEMIRLVEIIMSVLNELYSGIEDNMIENL